MNEERDELPIERLLRALVFTSQGKESRDINTGAGMLRRIQKLFASAWDHSQSGKSLKEWEHWVDLNMTIAVYNRAAKRCNLPPIKVPEINPEQASIGKGTPEKIMETFALQLRDAGSFLGAQLPLIDEALRRGKFKPEARSR